jgi:hypothetical protein
MSALQHRKGTMPRFNLPLSEEDAFVSLMSAIQVEVEFRRREFVATEELKAQVRRLFLELVLVNLPMKLRKRTKSHILKYPTSLYQQLKVTAEN